MFDKRVDIGRRQSDYSFFYKHYVSVQPTTVHRKTGDITNWQKLSRTTSKRDGLFNADAAEKARHDSQGKIEWAVQCSEGNKIRVWKKIKKLIKNININDLSSIEIISVEDLINEEKWTRRAVIISCVGGIGKSVFLSFLSTKIKEKEPDVWILKMNLMDHLETLSESHFRQERNVIDFLVNHPPVVGQSHFARSLLRYRLDTGDRVVIMMDGFDEIDSPCQEKAIQFMKIVTSSMKSVRLYVSTRPHVADELQLQLSQLAYTLDDFNEEEQIKYMTFLWAKKVPAVQEMEDATILLNRFAKSLIDRLSVTNSPLVGMPLLCHILAECSMENVHLIIQNPQDEEEPTGKQNENSFEGPSINLANLFKFRVFLREKFQTLNTVLSHQAATNRTNALLIKTETFLTKFAVECVIKDQSKVNILCQSTSSLEFETDEIDEESANTKNGVQLGFIFKNEENTKIQFLHRIYAEFLVAQYVCQGFLFDDNKRNKLLDKEPVCRLVANEILVENRYNGVRIFLDSMLEENEWRQINEHDLTEPFPDRLKTFADNIQSSEYIRIIKNRNSNLFVFLFDCLQSTSNQIKIKQIVESAFDSRFPFERYYEQSSRVFERLIKRYDVANDEKVKFILNKMLQDSKQIKKSLRCGHWKHDPMEKKKVLKIVLDFMLAAKEMGTLNAFLSQKTLDNKDNYADVLHFLICQEGYEDHLKQYLEIFSSVYANDDQVQCSLLKRLFRQHEKSRQFKERCRNLFNGKTQKALIILRDLGRGEVASRISCLVLKRDHLSFEEFYEPQKVEDDEFQEKLESLVERDSARMTRLHRAVYYNQERIVDQILEWAVGNKNNPKIIEWIVNCVARDDYGFAPFYVAFACGHKELCTKIMQFLQQVLGEKELEKYLSDKNGFLYRALKEAIIFEEIEMFEFILTNSKIILGRDLLDCVSMSRNWRKKYIPLIRYRKECFQSIAKYIIADDKHNNDRYKKLSDFVFLNEFKVHKMLINVVPAETLEKMFEADGGIRNWMQRFLKIERGLNYLRRIIENEITKSKDFRHQLIPIGREIIEERAANIAKEPSGHDRRSHVCMEADRII